MRRSIALALTGCLGLAEDLIHPLARKRFGHHPETDVIADPHPRHYGIHTFNLWIG